ncbi:hypothetical protein [Roseomonas gilardii]|uniref:hypothetical protein n=1 Tax=Roseomonas gilardii TaxID=257708 RepID=UPI0011A63A86|nr:hypothetical protein [Roseomonas gilardii]
MESVIAASGPDMTLVAERLPHGDTVGQGTYAADAGALLLVLLLVAALGHYFHGRRRLPPRKRNATALPQDGTPRLHH